MNAMKLYTDVKNTINTINSYRGDDFTVFFQPILNELLAETTVKTLTGEKKSAFQAALKFTKETAKYMAKHGREQLAGAWIDEKNGAQIICDSFTLLVYDKPFDGLPAAEYFGSKPLDYEKVIPATMTDTATLPDPRELRATYAADKMRHTGPAKYFNHYTAFNTHAGTTCYFDTLRLASAIECMASRSVDYDANNPFGVFKIIGPLGLAIVCACRVQNEAEHGYTIKHYTL